MDLQQHNQIRVLEDSMFVTAETFTSSLIVDSKKAKACIARVLESEKASDSAKLPRVLERWHERFPKSKQFSTGAVQAPLVPQGGGDELEALWELFYRPTSARLLMVRTTRTR